VAAPTNWSESRRRAPLVRRAGRFRGLSKGEASGAVGSGRDEVGCGGAFWVKIVAIAPPRAYPQPLDSQPRPERVPIWERSDTEVWLPRAEEGGIGIEKVAAGGRPLQTTLNDKKQAMIHERIVELIMSVQPRVFTTLTPNKIVDLLRLGEGTPPTLGISTGEVVDGFFSFLGFIIILLYDNHTLNIIIDCFKMPHDKDFCQEVY